MSYAEQLIEINVAITAILTGAQEYTISGRTIKRGQIDWLFKERQRLESLVNQGIAITTPGSRSKRVILRDW